MLQRIGNNFIVIDGHTKETSHMKSTANESQVNSWQETLHEQKISYEQKEEPAKTDNNIGTSAAVHLGKLPGDVNGEKPLFAMLTEAGSLGVYKPDNYDVNNPSYIVKGMRNGKEYSETVYINDVKPSNASAIEIAALQVHLLKTGRISNIEPGAFTRGDNGQFVNRSLFEKAGYLSLYKSMYENNLRLGNNRITSYLNKILLEMSICNNQTMQTDKK